MATNNGNLGKGKNKKKGLKLSTDPQSVAARARRHRITQKFKILQSLVPGGYKLDTVSLLDEAIHYVTFLKTQILIHQAVINFVEYDSIVLQGVPVFPQHQILPLQSGFGPDPGQEPEQSMFYGL